MTAADTRTSDDSTTLPLLVALMRRLEATTSLDALNRLYEPTARALLSSPRRRDLLRGTSLGHAVHPPLTDVPIGAWLCTSALDLAGGERARPAAQGLLALGLAAAVPTIVTGIAEWGATSGAERRVGSVHAMTNAVGVGLYGWSLAARLRGGHRAGALLAMAGGMAVSVGGFLGGHLSSARKVSSRHPIFGDDPALF